ncbi:SgcJ/EcaC family oxidoreductase [Sphaerisporangium album]|uniref:SgcJ/EcaC family oxidoreductase n=1 Tax=Sphaerisporangium album TaxID=509200 RepID=A0A367FLC2_9ACTN|nr:SgcJ/EcaC family oxidoreductase [Sphaerisporangium album]RCG31203.1 SgcJ/EcaC family oxidoreductase [Sphaerisporangium album]
MSATSTTVDDTTAVREVPRRMIAAWAKNDGEAFASIFTEDATMILPGDIYVTGRESIRAFMDAAYSGPYKGTRVFGEPLSAKFLGPEAAVLTTKGGVLTGEETEVSPERAIRATWVLAKQDGQWLVTAYQNTPIGA